MSWLSKHNMSSITCLNSAVDSNCDTSVSIWHHRLGHTPMAKLKQIHELSPLNSTNQTCVTCPMAKSTNLPYPLSDSYASENFELVHMDTWGPYKVPTQGHHKYFLTLVDDHSRHTWISLLTHKSDAFSVFKAFHHYAQTQF